MRQVAEEMGYSISIHAPRAGCDLQLFRVVLADQISIHAPRAGCDMELMDLDLTKLEFQSTHPVRGAT